MNISDTKKYQTVKWCHGGRVFPELDCWGLVNEIRRDTGRPVFPDHNGILRDGMDRVAGKFLRTLQPCEPEDGALVVCYSGQFVTHVAVVVAFDGFLYVAECNPKTNVSFLPVSRFEQKNAKVEYYR